VEVSVFQSASFRQLARTVAIALVVSTGSVASGDEALTWPEVNAAVRTRYKSVEYLSTSALAAWTQSDSVPKPILLDVRELDEYNVSHLQSAVVATELPTALAALSAVEKDHPIVVYCSVGHRSGALAEQLQGEGYTNVHNLEGSIFMWANEERAVFAGGTRVYYVHPYDQEWGVLLDRRFWPEAFE